MELSNFANLKKLMCTAFSILATSQLLTAQSTLVLQPDASSGKDAVVTSLAASTNYGSHPEFVALAGTNGGTPLTLRSLLQFDLSALPQGAVIDSAKLFLYSWDSPTNGKHRLDGGSNEATLSRITSSWDESTVTWANQPSTSTQNQVTLAGSSSTIQDYLDIDVTAIVKDMHTDATGNHGFLFELVTEQYYRTMLFASSDNVDALLRPKLVIYYTPAASACMELRPNAADGKDAVVTSLAASTNYGSHPEFVALAGTNGGTPLTLRSLIQFDFTSIPQDAVVDSAKLSLYSWNSPTNGKHRLDGGSNEATLSRITSSWDENTVTWANQPSASTQNQVTLAGSSSTIQDYLDIDITALVNDILTDASGNNGFLFELVTEQYYRTMLFASSDNSDAALHPKLKICYSTPSNVGEDLESASDFFLYPNPTQNMVFVRLVNTSNANITLTNLDGKTVYTASGISTEASIDVSNFAKGIYFVKVLTGNEIKVKKLLVN